ncbi:MAG TPA: energy-coupling factor transporter transmembrane protein EcfT [Chloroflexi bacterium]|nr:energy-coupling factor transporter transmembrane protein EcfT [Chloroflexota bacterium]
MNKTILGYVPEESPIYNTHPATRILFLLIVSLFPMFISAPEWNLLLVVLILILMRYSRIDFSILKLYVPVAVSMGSIILLSYTVFAGNHPEFHELARVLGIRIYYERILDAITVYFRILPMIFIMIYFLSTSRERDIIVAMRSLRIPYAVTYLVAMALRAVGMVIEDFSIVRQAEQARGFDPVGKSIFYKMRKFVMYIIPLFALALRRADEFANALIARGYSFTGLLSNPKRADYVLTHYQAHYWDYLISFVLIVMLVALVVMRYGLGMLSLEGSLTEQLLRAWLLN